MSILEIKNFSFYYANKNDASLEDINLSLAKSSVTALIGPSGCGKSTLLRSINRICDITQGNRYKGEIIFKGKNILSKNTNLIKLRSKIGMIFQAPTPFNMSIRDNVLYGLKIKGIKNKAELNVILESSLKKANLWKEVKDRLDSDAIKLSGGQAQRLCIARAIALSPEILLFDEPTSALDPISTAAIEELILELKQKYCVLIVTHNMSQAKRIADVTAFMYLGKLIEAGNSKDIFNRPKTKLLSDYVGGKIG